jgi:hypothetical protein
MVGSGDALERIRFRQTAEDRFSFDRYFLPLTTPCGQKIETAGKMSSYPIPA